MARRWLAYDGAMDDGWLWLGMVDADIDDPLLGGLALSATACGILPSDTVAVEAAMHRSKKCKANQKPG